MRIAIVGSGVAGLVCAHVLGDIHDVVVYEQDGRPGGHAHTQRISLDDGDLDVDTGFLVHNPPNYPGLGRLFAELGVETRPSEMSFSVHDQATGICWRGTSVASVFAQRANLVRPEFLRMLADVVAFNRHCRRLVAEHADDPVGADVGPTLGELVAGRSWSPRLLDWYLVPLGSAVWSADPDSFLDMPALTFARFFDNHGLLQLGAGKGWRTVVGGSHRYVGAIADRLGDRLRLGTPVLGVARRDDAVAVRSGAGTESFDHVVLATHSDQALAVLDDPTPVEREVLGAIRYTASRATLHTDERLLPPERRAWASWNYDRPATPAGAATVTYLLNRLQGLPTRHQVCVTLNRDDEIRPERVLARMRYDHPVYDRAAVAAQGRHAEISGTGRTSYCGAYWGHGFHEDGLQSALRVCDALGAPHRLAAS